MPSRLPSLTNLLENKFNFLWGRKVLYLNSLSENKLDMSLDSHLSFSVLLIVVGFVLRMKSLQLYFKVAQTQRL